MRRSVIIVACALVVAAAVVLASPARDTFGAQPAIAGGVAADYRRYPWFVSMLTRGGRGHCGGVLVEPTTVISAGHCEVSPGQNVVIGGTEVRAIASIERHPFLDAMLLKLRAPSTRAPIKVAAALPPPNTPVVVLGRGGKAPGSTEDPGAFTKTFLSTLSRELMTQALPPDARAYYATNPAAFGLRSPWLPDARGACSGDSGGPVIVEKGPGNDELVGIIVAGTADGLCRNTGARVTIAMSAPYLWANRGRDAQFRASLASCAFRKAGARLCCKTHPWYTGSLSTLADALTNKQCAATYPCAKLVNDLYRLRGDTPQPVVNAPLSPACAQ